MSEQKTLREILRAFANDYAKACSDGENANLPLYRIEEEMRQWAKAYGEQVRELLIESVCNADRGLHMSALQSCKLPEPK